MTSNRINRPVIVICLLSAAALLVGCSPPIPKTSLPPAGGMMGGIPVSIDRWHGVTTFPLTTPVED